MTAKSEKLQHVSGPVAKAIADHINGATSNADILCRSGISYPIAIELARQMAAGLGDVGKLHRAGFSGSDATEIASQISSRGAH
jgi:hypothetical protein